MSEYELNMLRAALDLYGETLKILNKHNLYTDNCGENDFFFMREHLSNILGADVWSGR